MRNDSMKMWEAWGRTNALYTSWCNAAGQNSYRLLVLYAINAHEPITQKEIADCTGLSKQTVSTVMRAMKTEQLVTLTAGGTDRREKNVQLTEAGKAYAEQILAPLYQLEQQVYDIMGADRMKAMSDAISLFNIVFETEMEKRLNEQNKH